MSENQEKVQEKKLISFWIDKELMRLWRMKLAEKEALNQSAWLGEKMTEYINS